MAVFASVKSILLGARISRPRRLRHAVTLSFPKLVSSIVANWALFEPFSPLEPLGYGWLLQTARTDSHLHDWSGNLVNWAIHPRISHSILCRRSGQLLGRQAGPAHDLGQGCWIAIAIFFTKALESCTYAHRNSHIEGDSRFRSLPLSAAIQIFLCLLYLPAYESGAVCYGINPGHIGGIVRGS